ncbi:hypothetical protein D9M73_147350 [compost metagenome]
MVHRIGARTDQPLQRIIVAQIDRVAVAALMVAERRGLENAVHRAHAALHHLHIARIAEESGVDQRRGAGIDRGEAHRTVAFGPEDADMAGKAMPRHLGAAMILERSDHEMQLHVGGGCIGRHRQERPGLGKGRRHHALPLAQPLEKRAAHRQRALERRTDKVRSRRLERRDIIDMVLQIGPDRRPVDPHGNALLAQVRAGTDPRQHQQLRGPEHAARQNDAAPRANDLRLAILQIGDAPHAPFIEQDALGGDAGQDMQIGIGRAIPQIGARRGPAFAILLRHLIQANAFLPLAIEIHVARDLQARPRLDEVEAARIGEFLVAHPQGPVAAMIGIAAPNIVLAAFEPGQHLVI